MILVEGKMLESEQINQVLSSLEKNICRTLEKPLLDPMIVIEACEKLSEYIEIGKFSTWIDKLIEEEQVTTEQIQMVVQLLKKESLVFKMEMELGQVNNEAEVYTPLYEEYSIHRRRMPLGVLFHIAAGNLEGLPAYSVIEGLLAGNVNILKLPSVDKGLTIELLWELIKIEPRLKDYIYVFDITSNDIRSMKKMERCSDGIVVWGGDLAVEAVRKIATPNTKIIEWGHKISFAYVTKQGMNHEEMTELAHHMFRTKQLLCSSCQGIFLDTNQMKDVYDFSEKFAKILDQVSKEYAKPSMGIQAQITLLLYQQTLEKNSHQRIYKGNYSSVIAVADHKLEVSYTHGNCWVKPLPRELIVKKLHRYKGYLQTVGLICTLEEREKISELLGRAGATRITTGKEMSRMLCGENHDGQYPLRQYTKVLEY